MVLGVSFPLQEKKLWVCTCSKVSYIYKIMYIWSLICEKLPPPQVFSVCGEIMEVRMIQDQKGGLKVNLHATHLFLMGMNIYNAAFFLITLWMRRCHEARSWILSSKFLLMPILFMFLAGILLCEVFNERICDQSYEGDIWNNCEN